MDKLATVNSEAASPSHVDPTLFQPTICGRKFRETLQLTAQERDGVVLDLGTGTGILAHAMAAQGAKSVIGVDIDPVAIQQAQAALTKSQRDIKFMIGDLFQSPSGQFDLITLNPPFFPSIPTTAVPTPVRWAFDGGPTGKEFLLRVIDTIPPRLATGGRFVWGMPAFWEPTIGRRLAQFGFSVRSLSTFPIDCADYSQTLARYGFDPAAMLGALADCEDWRVAHQQPREEWIRSGTLEMAIGEARG